MARVRSGVVGRPVSIVLVLAAVVGCAPVTADPAGASGSAAAAPRVDPLGIAANVATVRTLGWWAQDDGAEGTYRLVIVDQGFDQIVSRVYLQWIEVGPEGTPRVRATRAFARLDEVPLYKLDVARTATDARGVLVTLDARNAYSGETARFEIRAGRPGQAELLAR